MHSLESSARCEGRLHHQLHPIGMFPDVDSSPYDGERMEMNTLVFDTVYNPESTLFVKQARKLDATCYPGPSCLCDKPIISTRPLRGWSPG